MPLLEVHDLCVRYHRPGGKPLTALQDVSLHVEKGEILGIVGGSGSGKSTLARVIVGLLNPWQGRVLYQGKPVARLDRAGREEYCRHVQMVFQDAVGSLNPRMTAGEMLAEVLHVHGLPQDEPHVIHLLEQVGLPPETATAYARELSGGQCQRVSLARCLALQPRVLVADEPVSALDVSVQARVLNLLQELRKSLGLAVLLVAHDLAVVRNVCDRVCVLSQGRIVEEGPVESVLEHPQHPYTQELLEAIPDVERGLSLRDRS